MRMENYKKADSAFMKVTELSPEYIQGYIYRAQANFKLDEGNKQGLAKPYYEKVIQLGEVDKAKNSKYLIEAYRYMGDYAYTVQKDLPASKSYFNKILELAPDDQQALDVLRALNNPGAKNKK